MQRKYTRLAGGCPSLHCYGAQQSSENQEQPSESFSLRDFSSTLFASFSLWATSLLARVPLDSARIWAARIPALLAPGLPMATVATGMPAGICTVARSE